MSVILLGSEFGFNRTLLVWAERVPPSFRPRGGGLAPAALSSLDSEFEATNGGQALRVDHAPRAAAPIAFLGIVNHRWCPFRPPLVSAPGQLRSSAGTWSSS